MQMIEDVLAGVNTFFHLFLARYFGRCFSCRFNAIRGHGSWSAARRLGYGLMLEGVTVGTGCLLARPDVTEHVGYLQGRDRLRARLVARARAICGDRGYVELRRTTVIQSWGRKGD